MHTRGHTYDVACHRFRRRGVRARVRSGGRTDRVTSRPGAAVVGASPAARYTWAEPTFRALSCALTIPTARTHGRSGLTCPPCALETLSNRLSSSPGWSVCFRPASPTARAGWSTDTVQGHPAPTLRARAPARLPTRGWISEVSTARTVFSAAGKETSRRRVPPTSLRPARVARGRGRAAAFAPGISSLAARAAARPRTSRSSGTTSTREPSSYVIASPRSPGPWACRRRLAPTCARRRRLPVVTVSSASARHPETPPDRSPSARTVATFASPSTSRGRSRGPTFPRAYKVVQRSPSMESCRSYVGTIMLNGGSAHAAAPANDRTREDSGPADTRSCVRCRAGGVADALTPSTT